MIQKRVRYFENLAREMDKKSIKKKKSVESGQTTQNKVKKFICEAIEIKRPNSKSKHNLLEDNNDISVTTKFGTLPAASKYQKDKSKITRHFSAPNKLRNGFHSTNSTMKSSVNKKEVKSKSLDLISGEEEEIEKKIEEFGAKLKERRYQVMESKSDSDHEDNSEACTLKSTSSEFLASSSLEIDFQNLHDLTTNPEIESLSNEHLAPDPLEITFKGPFHDPVINPEAADDIFGLNDFDENCDDNYITEAYNEEGRELIFTFLEINRRTYRENEDENEINYLINSSDLVLHENETENFEVIKDVEGIVDNNSESTPIDGSTLMDDFEHLRQSVKYLLNINGGDSEGSAEHKEDSGAVILDENISDSDINNASGPLNGELEAEVTDEEEDKSHSNKNFYQTYELLEDELKRDIIDEEGNVRIKFTLDENKNENILPTNKKEKVIYVIEELINTEEQYVRGLRKIVKDYKPYVELNSNKTNSLIGKWPYLFGNIKSIYEQSKKFLQELKDNSTGGPNGIAFTFLKFKDMFDLYPIYSKNKPRADVYLKEFDEIIRRKQNELGDKLDLASYLLTPIQRLGKYVLMLEQIQKELEKVGEYAGNVKSAKDGVKRVMRRGNDSIAADSIKSCRVDLSLQGSFIMREKFTVLKPKRFESMVFLFENIIVFTQNIPRSMEEFCYVESIRMSDMSLAMFEEKPLIFHITDYSRAKRAGPESFNFVLEARTKKIKGIWTKTLKEILWDQLTKAKEQLMQQQGDEGKRFSKINLPKISRTVTPRRRRASTKKSVFYDDRYLTK